MYFTDTPSLGSIEAIMKRPPGQRQRGRREKAQVIQLHQERLRLPSLPVLTEKMTGCTLFGLPCTGHPFGMRCCHFEGSRFICISGCAAHAVSAAARQTI